MKDKAECIWRVDPKCSGDIKNRTVFVNAFGGKENIKVMCCERHHLVALAIQTAINFGEDFDTIMNLSSDELDALVEKYKKQINETDKAQEI